MVALHLASLKKAYPFRAIVARDRADIEFAWPRSPFWKQHIRHVVLLLLLVGPQLVCLLAPCLLPHSPGKSYRYSTAATCRFVICFDVLNLPLSLPPPKPGQAPQTV